MPGLSLAQATKYAPFVQKALDEFEINTRLRVCAFLAQVAHETNDLMYQAEIWGPTAAQKRYDTRVDLGNTPEVDGDGYKYRGRGAFQLTGAANYRAAGKALGLDLFKDPDRADDIDVSFRIAGHYWRAGNPRRVDLNKLADKLTGARDRNEVKVFTAITKVINGGTNGLEDRVIRYARVLKAIPAEVPAPKEQPAILGISPQGIPVVPVAPGAPADVTATAQTSEPQHLADLLKNETVKTKAMAFLPALLRYIVRPLVLLKGAIEAGSWLAISGTVAVVVVLAVLAYLHRAEIKRAVNAAEDFVRRTFLKQ